MDHIFLTSNLVKYSSYMGDPQWVLTVLIGSTLDQPKSCSRNPAVDIIDAPILQPAVFQILQPAVFHIVGRGFDNVLPAIALTISAPEWMETHCFTTV